MTSRRGATAFGWFGCAVLAAGCGPDRPRQYPVSGRVVVNGKPADRATVTFSRTVTPDGPPLLALATTGPDGAFRLSPPDGISAGNWAVTVAWPKYIPGGDEEIVGADRLKGRYADPKKPVATVTITDSENALPPFDLPVP